MQAVDNQLPQEHPKAAVRARTAKRAKVKARVRKNEAVLHLLTEISRQGTVISSQKELARMATSARSFMTPQPLSAPHQPIKKPGGPHKPIVEESCVMFSKGKCRFGNSCKYKHDKVPAAPAAKAEPKAQAKAKAKAKATPARPRINVAPAAPSPQRLRGTRQSVLVVGANE